MIDYTQKFFPGCRVSARTRGPAPKEVPSWLDKEKFRRGQRFATDHMFATLMCETMSLLLLFAFPDAMQGLIFSEGTDTYEKAKARYTSTLNRLANWYKCDLWSESPGRRHIEVVRSLHASVQEKIRQTPKGEIPSKTTLAGKFTSEFPTPIVGNGLFHADIKASVKPPEAGQIPSASYDQEDIIPFNQGEFLMTQFSFVGLVILKPEKFGIINASYEDLDAFIHMWRGICYLLGIEDEYNFCSEDLETVKTQSKQVLDKWLVPSLHWCSEDWEHMSRCVVAPFNGVVDLEACLYYTCNSVMGVPLPRFYASLSWSSRLKVALLDFVLTKVLPIRPLRHAFNWLIEKVSQKAQKTPKSQSCSYSQFIGLKNKIL